MEEEQLKNGKELTDVEVSKIAFVKRPANGVPILLFKSVNKGDKLMSEELKIDKELVEPVKKMVTPMEDEKSIDAIFKDSKLDDENKAALRGALRLIKSVKLEDGMIDKLVTEAGYKVPEPDALKKEVTELKKSAKEKDAEIERLNKEDAKLIIKSDGSINENHPDVKVMSPEMKELFQKSEKDNAAARESITKMEREGKVVKCEKEIKEICKEAGKTEEVADLLVTIEEKAGEDIAKKVKEIFKANTEQIKTGNLYKENGTARASDPDSKDAKVIKLAKQKMEKDTKLTEAQAKLAVYDENPELAEED